MTANDSENDGSKFDPEKIAAFPVFDVAAHLDTPSMMAAYLTEHLAAGDIPMIMDALQTASRAKGMAEVAVNAGLATPALYKALKGTQPRLETVMGVLKALGLRLAVVPLEPDAAPDMPD
jgi:probable addiction module antidote protein